MSMLTPGGLGLARLMEEIPRGPRREGVFALWLTLRLVEDLALTPAQPERGVKRRVAALGKRLTSLNLPASLRRALHLVLLEVEQNPEALPGPVLLSLAGPVRETLGPEVADLVARAARGAAQRAREGS